MTLAHFELNANIRGEGALLDYFEAGIFRPGEKEPPVKADAARESYESFSLWRGRVIALHTCERKRDKCELCDLLQNIEGGSEVIHKIYCKRQC